MNVYDYAVKMEEDGKAFYERLAREADNPGLTTIFNRLARDEQRHLEIFQGLKAQAQAATLEETTVLEDTRNVFEEMVAEQQDKGGTAVTGDLEGYRYAMRIEAESYRLYEDAARRESNEQIKRLLLQIAEEEHRHFMVVENIYQFVNAPNQYLAWGEFSNLDEFRNFGRDTDI